MKWNVLFLVTLLAVASCKGGGKAKASPAKAETPKIDSSKIFEQYFELPGSQFVDFTQCDFNVPCYAEIVNANTLCKGTAFIVDSGGMQLSNFVKQSDSSAVSQCTGLNGQYYFEVVACQGWTQNYFVCGQPQYPYDLLVEPF